LTNSDTSQREERSKRASFWYAPTDCTPKGKPLDKVISGKFKQGKPAKLHVVCMMGLPVEAKPTGAVPKAAGHKMPS
jgi:hypothetical protein